MASAACSAFGCDNHCGRDGKQPGITFHRFPMDKPNMLAKWLTAMQMPKWLPQKQNFLCSIHFSEDMFIEKEGYRFLKYDAIPTMFQMLPPPKALFPSDWDFKIVTEKEVKQTGSKGYIIEAKLAIQSEEKFNVWLKQHESISKVNYRLLLHKKGAKNLFLKSEYGCRHLSGEKSNVLQFTCPAKLLMRIRSPITPKYSKLNDDNAKYPCTVVLYHLHNHKVESNMASVVSIKADDVDEDVKQKLAEMFRGGYNAEMALSTHQSDILEDYTDEYEAVLSDHYICPNLEWVSDFYETYTKQHGVMTDNKMLVVLQNEICKINGEKGKVKIKKVEDGNVVIAICTSLMERAHSLKSSGETVFLDSSGFMVRSKCYIYILMAYSCTEGLPLGVLITTSDSESVLTAGFHLLAEVLPAKAFGQYGMLGPEIFLTANSDVEQKSLKAVFPESTLLLCSFSLLKGLWWWLWDEKNNIEESDRCTLFALENVIMKTKNSAEFTQCYESTMKNEVVQKYENFQAYFKEINDVSERWAVRFKNELVDREKDISAVEMGSLVLRDRAYLANKAYSILQVLKYIVNDVEGYYKEKMIHCINNTLDKFTQSSYKPEMRSVEDLESELLPTGQYRVHNKVSRRSYFVDMSMCLCSCPQGLLGSKCKHQYAICTSHKLDISSPVPDDETIRKELHWIATNSMNSLFSNMGKEKNIEETVNYKHDDEEYDPKHDVQRRYIKPKPKKVPTPKEEAKSILDRVTKDILLRYDKNPEEFHKAIVTAAVNYQGLQFDHAVLAALKAFGRN